MKSMQRAAANAVVRIAAVALIVTVSCAVPAQTADRSLHIGILSSGSLENRSSLEDATVEGLRERGYVEGKNLIIERRYSSSKLKENADQLAGMGLDAIMTTCTPSTRIMKEATAATPIVMAAVSDPVRQGIISSLAKPGRNVTGTSSEAEDLLPKRLELLALVVPKSTPVAVLLNAANPVHALGWQRLVVAAQGMGIKLIKVELKGSDELNTAMETASRAQAAALFVMPDDPLMFNLRPQIVETAKKYRMPDVYWAREFVESGGLMSYGESLPSSYRATAAYIDKIKKGVSPGDLPVAQPTKFELVLNAKTAAALGLTIQQSLLLRADDVIQ